MSKTFYLDCNIPRRVLYPTVRIEAYPCIEHSASLASITDILKAIASSADQKKGISITGLIHMEMKYIGQNISEKPGILITGLLHVVMKYKGQNIVLEKMEYLNNWLTLIHMEMKC